MFNLVKTYYMIIEASRESMLTVMCTSMHALPVRSRSIAAHGNRAQASSTHEGLHRGCWTSSERNIVTRLSRMDLKLPPTAGNVH